MIETVDRPARLSSALRVNVTLQPQANPSSLNAAQMGKSIPVSSGEMHPPGIIVEASARNWPPVLSFKHGDHQCLQEQTAQRGRYRRDPKFVAI